MLSGQNRVYLYFSFRKKIYILTVHFTVILQSITTHCMSVNHDDLYFPDILHAEVTPVSAK